MPLEVSAYIAGLIYGAGKITRKRTTSVRHTPSYCFSIASGQALTLLRQVTPFLRSYNRQRATLALAWYQALTPRNGKYSPTLLTKRGEFEQAFLCMTSKQQLSPRGTNGR